MWLSIFRLAFLFFLSTTDVIRLHLLSVKHETEHTFQSFFFFPKKISHFTSMPSLARVPNAQAGAGHRDDVFALVLVPLPLGLGLWSRASTEWANIEPTALMSSFWLLTKTYLTITSPIWALYVLQNDLIYYLSPSLGIRSAQGVKKHTSRETSLRFGVSYRSVSPHIITTVEL